MGVSWPSTWVNNPGGPLYPPPQGFTSYRSAPPQRVGPHTFILSSEGTRNSGGKGLTYNIDSSTYGTWVGGGLDVYLGSAGYRELYLRMYLKFDPVTFHWGTVVPNFGMQKLARVSRLKCVPDTGSTCNPMVFYSGSSKQAPTFYPDFFDNPAYNTPPSINPIHLEPSVVTDPGAGSASPDDQWQIPWPRDGKWHAYEFRVKMNSSPGLANGEWEVWIDGSTDTAHHFVRRNVAWVGSTAYLTPGWNWVTMMDNATIQPDPAYANTVMKLFMDDVVIATNYTGPPPSPTGVTAKAVSSSSAQVSWAAGTSTVPFTLTGYRVYYGLDPNNLSNVYSAGTSTTATISNLQSGQTYYFAVTAYTRQSYDVADNESLRSTSVSAATPAGTSGTTADTTPPTVSLTSPISGSTVSGTVKLAASASDNVGVSKVEFYVNNALYGVTSTSPYSVNWSTGSLPNGSTSTLAAKAYDAAGNSKVSSPVTVTVNNSTSTVAPTTTTDTTGPAITISSPVAGSKVPSTVTIATSATDPSGVMQLRIYVDSVLKSYVYGSSLSYAWNTSTYATGAHTIMIYAFDNLKNLSIKSITVYK